MVRVSLFFLIFLVFFSCKDSPHNCQIDYFEEMAEIQLGEDIEVVECGDNLETKTWMFAKINPRNIATILATEDRIEPYDSLNIAVPPPPEDSGQPYHRTSFHDLILTDISRNFSESVPAIKNSNQLYVAEYCNGRQLVKYAIDRKESLLWIYVWYPDWHGGAPC